MSHGAPMPTLVIALVIGARQWDVRMIARLVPYCAILFKRLLGDPRVSRQWKVASVLAVVYRYARDQINRRPADPVEDGPPIGGDTGKPAGA